MDFFWAFSNEINSRVLFLGYLNESGKLNLEHFEAYMKKLASFDIKKFREQYDDLKYMKAKSSRNGLGAGVSRKCNYQTKPF